MINWEPRVFQAQGPNSWLLQVFYRTAQKGWVFQATKKNRLYFCGLKCDTPEQAQKAAEVWAHQHP